MRGYDFDFVVETASDKQKSSISNGRFEIRKLSCRVCFFGHFKTYVFFGFEVFSKKNGLKVRKVTF